MTINFIRLQEKLLETKAIILNKDELEFPDDYVFSSPSIAAAMVIGCNANGLTEWKLKDGTTLKDFELEKK
jgi:hypothetical protein